MDRLIKLFLTPMIEPIIEGPLGCWVATTDEIGHKLLILEVVTDLLMSLSKKSLVGIGLPLGIGTALILVAGHPPGGLKGSRLKSAEISEHAREVLKEIDPIDSLYFDVSVARHMLEEGNSDKAKEWLDPNHALGELKKSYQSKFLDPAEFDEVGGDIIKIKDALDGGRTAEAHAIIVPLQNKLAERAYLTFKELDPIPEGYIDGRYEAAREQIVAEWRTKGYHEALIEKGLKWGDAWAKGIAQRFIKDPALQTQVAETLYPESLELSARWIEAMMK